MLSSRKVSGLFQKPTRYLCEQKDTDVYYLLNFTRVRKKYISIKDFYEIYESKYFFLL